MAIVFCALAHALIAAEPFEQKTASQTYFETLGALPLPAGDPEGFPREWKFESGVFTINQHPRSSLLDPSNSTLSPFVPEIEIAANFQQFCAGHLRRQLDALRSGAVDVQLQLRSARRGQRGHHGSQPVRYALERLLVTGSFRSGYSGNGSRSSSNCTPKLFSAIDTMLYSPTVNTRSIICCVL